jgi:putative sterol carrier protein
VVFAMPGAPGRTVALRMEGGRAKSLDDIPVTPTVRLTMDVETFTCLGCGRWTPEAAVQAGKVQMTGDTTLGQTILAQMNIMV